MFKERPNRSIDEKIRAGLNATRHHRARLGTYEWQRAVEKAALLSAVNEASSVPELREILRYLINER